MFNAVKVLVWKDGRWQKVLLRAGQVVVESEPETSTAPSAAARAMQAVKAVGRLLARSG
jgi:hypothetical protein